MDSKIQKPTTTLSETLMLYEFLILQSPGWSYCKDHFRWNVSKVGFGVTVAKYLSCFSAQDDISIGGFGSHLFIPENGQALISSWKNLYCVQTWFQKSYDEFWTDVSYFLMNLVIGKEVTGLRTSITLNSKLTKTTYSLVVPQIILTSVDLTFFSAMALLPSDVYQISFVGWVCCFLSSVGTPYRLIGSQLTPPVKTSYKIFLE